MLRYYTEFDLYDTSARPYNGQTFVFLYIAPAGYAPLNSSIPSGKTMESRNGLFKAPWRYIFCTFCFAIFVFFFFSLSLSSFNFNFLVMEFSLWQHCFCTLVTRVVILLQYYTTARYLQWIFNVKSYRYCIRVVGKSETYITSIITNCKND